MKSKMNLLALSALFGAFAFSMAAPTSSSPEANLPVATGVKKANAGESHSADEQYIPFNADNFVLTASENCVGGVSLSSFAQTRGVNFWETRTTNALDTFLDGWKGTEKNQGTYTIETKNTWNQGGHAYITFTMAGANYENGRVEILSGETIIATVHNDYFKDNEISQNHVLRVVEIPEAYRNSDLKLRIVDGEANASFTFVSFGSLRVAQDAGDVARMIALHTNNLGRANNEAAYKATTALYKVNQEAITSVYGVGASTIYAKATAEYGPFLGMGLTSYDVSFDKATDLSLMGVNYDRSAGIAAFNWEKAINTKDVNYDWREAMPFNKVGDGFLCGRDAALDGSESTQYCFMTPTFTLSGSGVISVRMAGNGTGMYIFTENANGDLNTEPAETITNTAFATDGISNIFASNFNTNTMVNYVVDASKYLGQRIAIGLADMTTNSGNWYLGTFDELVTYYETAPAGRYDALEQQYDDNHFYGERVDRFVVLSGGNADTAAAYAFLNDFYATVRPTGGENVPTHCGRETSAFSSLITQYNNLSTGAKAIVDASKDFDHGTGTNWFLSPSSEGNVGATMAYLMNSATATANQLNIGGASSSVIYIVTAAAAGLIAVSALFLLRHKKKEQ